MEAIYSPDVGSRLRSLPAVLRETLDL
jgi:hypothetical protein